MEKHSKRLIYGGLVTILLLIGLLAYGYILHAKLTAQHASLGHELEATKATLAEKEALVADSEKMLDEIRQAYALSEENGSELHRLLTEEKGRNETFEDQISNISGTVGKLDKLSKIDPELLQKYSKIYFLNEHYAPEKVAEIEKTFRFKTDEPEYIHARVEPFLVDMLEDAQNDGINLLVVSAFRSFDEQKNLKSTYTTIYGSGANAFSADQGYSEHQLGTTLDFTTTEIGRGLTGFETTEAYAWLQKNAYKHGFVLSYPKDNGYYIFEPWHWRFVGEDLADDLHDDEKSFYDLDQREIDKYLIKLFD
jgi:LAS superfamily LD-carboxypeptidase LdcB